MIFVILTYLNIVCTKKKPNYFFKLIFNPFIRTHLLRETFTKEVPCYIISSSYFWFIVLHYKYFVRRKKKKNVILTESQQAFAQETSTDVSDSVYFQCAEFSFHDIFCYSFLRLKCLANTFSFLKIYYRMVVAMLRYGLIFLSTS